MIKNLRNLLFMLTPILGFSQSIFINEIHYDNDGADIEEAIEVAAPAGTLLDGWQLVLYNGSNGAPYNTLDLAGTVADQVGGYGTQVVSLPSNGLQNGSPDGIALLDATGTVAQFLSYEGTMMAASGAAAGLESEDIGVEETNATPIGASLSLVGDGNAYEDFTWEVTAVNSFGEINTGQTFNGQATAPKINEFVFNHTGSDTDEFVEILGSATSDISAYSLLIIEGDENALGIIDVVLPLTTTDENGYFVTNFSSNTFENGSQTLLLVADFTGAVGDDLDANDDGALDSEPWSAIADGLTVLDGGVNDLAYSETILNPDFDGGTFTVGGASRIPDGTDTDSATDWVRNSFNGAGLPSFPNAETESGTAQNTPGTENRLGTVINDAEVVINELDADTQGTDTQEFLELYDGGQGNIALAGLVVVLYNGNNDASYAAFDLDEYATNAEGYFVLGNTDVPNVDYVVASNTFQNGADAVVVYRGDATDFPNGTPVVLDNIVDAIVYGTGDETDEGLLPLLNEGQEQLDEDINGNKDGESLQRVPNGSGGVRNTATYRADLPTPGTENGVEVEPTTPISIAEARNAAEGETITITGILTVSDQFGGPAYIQDSTAGIAVFDEAVQGDGIFTIGDSLTITGTRTSFNGLVQVSPVNVVTKNQAPIGQITPRTITLSQLGEYPGELVRIENVAFPAPGDLFFGNSNYIVTDASGEAELRIDADSGELVGKAQPDTCASVVGVVGRFNETFQLLPRLGADIPCAEPYVNPGSGSNIPKEDTFDVAAWNIEWFGDEGNSPAAGNPLSDPIQRDSVLTVLKGIDADVFAVEEISDDVLFAELVSLLPGYDYILSDAVSYPDGTPPFQKVGFIYKTETVTPIKTQALLATIHPYYNGGDASALVNYPAEADRFYASGRLPFLMTANVTINGNSQEIDLIALHARANSGTSAQNRYDMRKYDVEVLKDSLDVQFADRKVILMGDYNDDVDETVADGINTTVSSYVEYVNDAANYSVVTSVLSDEGKRSYVFRENMIDHILITDELFDTYLEGSATVNYEYYDADYTQTASDHFPVSARFKWNTPLKFEDVETVPASCYGESDGMATVYVSGGVQPYSYLWSDGQTEATATNLMEGTYSVSITDAGGSNIEVNAIEITAPEAITYTVPKTVDVYKGYEDCTTLSISAIEAGDAYTILWSTGETAENINVCPAESTTYEVTVTNADGCSITKEIFVNVIDVSCGGNRWNPKVQVCYKGKTLCVSSHAVKALLRNGGTLGSCSQAEERIILSSLTLYPNPVRNTGHISVESILAATVRFEVYNLFGIKVFAEDVSVADGKTQINLNFGSLWPGIYILKPKYNGNVQDSKVFVKR
ncbi:endonuclease/exonuclease/phosphatase family protein [Flavimarina sp. Hel_I_48]|uniref:endonuclease/exonuclease/phosphatase family protein n=1 Tax=Flavimarina sp. Hel_I_48 TaxID=1392488 RepID=UPI0004DF3EAE|nr:endonuclease/exonuclease/phosphatase family protein [Flavimarina sp. Hel_I_48]